MSVEDERLIVFIDPSPAEQFAVDFANIQKGQIVAACQWNEQSEEIAKEEYLSFKHEIADVCSRVVETLRLQNA